MSFTKDGKAFLVNASGRIVDVPELNVDVYLARGYKAATEAQVRASGNYSSVFGEQGKAQDDVLRSLKDQQTRTLDAISQRLRDEDDSLNDRVTGGEVHPPMTSLTVDGFPKDAKKGGNFLVKPRNQVKTAAPDVQEGERPNSTREGVGVIVTQQGAKTPEEAVKDGDVKVIVDKPELTATVVHVNTNAPAGDGENGTDPQSFTVEDLGDANLHRALNEGGITTWDQLADHDFAAKPVANIGEARLKTISEKLAAREQ